MTLTLTLTCVQAVADRLAEAYAEMLHADVRRDLWGTYHSLTCIYIDIYIQGRRGAVGEDGAN